MAIPRFANAIANLVSSAAQGVGGSAKSAKSGGASRGNLRQQVSESASSKPKAKKQASPKSNEPDYGAQAQRIMDKYNQEKEESKTGQADEAADNLDSFENDKTEEQQKEEEKQNNTITDAEDMFLADFNTYSKNNLGGMGLYDFLEVDPNSQEDYDMWEAFWNDPAMGRYYGEQKQEYGDFDAYWNAMMANTIDDIMADPDLQRQYFNNTGGDSMLQIFQGVANAGFIPEISGDQWQQDELEDLYMNDRDLSALTMMYQYGMNGVLDEDSGLDLETDPLAIAKLNDYLQLGNMQFGYGDGYDTKVGKVPEYTESLYVDPSAYQRSVDEGLSSVPGYGLPDIGIRALMNERYGTGYQLRPGVEDLYSQYSSTGEDEEQA